MGNLPVTFIDNARRYLKNTIERLSIVAFPLSRNLSIGLILLFTLLIGGVIFTSYNEIDKSGIVEEVEPKPIHVVGHFEFVGIEGFPQAIIFTIDRLLIDSRVLDTEIQNEKKICVSSFGFAYIVSGRKYSVQGESYEAYYVSPLDNIVRGTELSCVEGNNLLGRPPKTYEIFDISSFKDENNQNKLRLEVPLDNSLYFAYPFDYIQLTTGLSLGIVYIDENGQVLKTASYNPSIDIVEENKTMGFKFAHMMKSQENYTKLPYTDFLGTGENSYSFKLARPASIIYLTSLLLAFLLIVPILLPFVNTFDTALQSIVAYLLGLWGARQVIMPNQIVNPNLLDLLLMGFYCVAIFSLLVTLVQQNQLKKKHLLTNKFQLDKYYSFTTSHVYHSFDCAILKTHKSPRLIEYASEQAAIESGKHRCKLCSLQSA